MNCNAMNIIQRYLIAGLLALTVANSWGDNHNFAVARNLETFSNIYKNLDLMYVET